MCLIQNKRFHASSDLEVANRIFSVHNEMSQGRILNASESDIICITKCYLQGCSVNKKGVGTLQKNSHFETASNSF